MDGNIQAIEGRLDSEPMQVEFRGLRNQRMDSSDRRKNLESCESLTPYRRFIYVAGGAAGCLLILYSLGTMCQIILLGGPPTSAIEAFALLQTNRVLGLMRLDFLTMIAMPLYYCVFLGLFMALKRVDPALPLVSLLLVFVGVTLLLATPGAFSMLWLSEKHALADSETTRRQLEAAGEAILASDLWHGTGAILGGILVQCGGVLMSAAMIRTEVFSKACAYVGILSFGLDLLRILLGLFAPWAAFLMTIAGPLYLVWFYLVSRTLFTLPQNDPFPGFMAST